MSKIYTDLQIANRLWFHTGAAFGLGSLLVALWEEPGSAIGVSVLVSIGSAILSLPGLMVLNIFICRIHSCSITLRKKLNRLLWLLFFITLSYGVCAGLIMSSFSYEEDPVQGFLLISAACTGVLFACTCIAFAVNYKIIKNYFASTECIQESNTESFEAQTNTYMEPDYITEQVNYQTQKMKPMNKTLSKAIVTGILILAMLIPTFFISGLVTEREDRQEKIVEESGNRWSNAQTLSGPYIFIPYKNTAQHIIVLPENENVNGEVIPEERDRSIYKVLFYKSNIKGKGNFLFKLPREVDSSSLQLSDAKICFGISDYKGIEDKVSVTFNNVQYELSPGLPAKDIDSIGLSAPVQLSADDLSKTAVFNYSLNIKGSGRLHFLPLSGNSSFALRSTWRKPSFDGNTLPTDNSINENGFTAKWVFNRANIPFGTVITDSKIIAKNIDFGVSIMQPADHYAKTARCIKYAILFIGLTFSLFFIVEIMQKKNMHPVQYILVGLALVIFYTLLLSISEYLFFDYAYLIASVATVALISLYAKGHFKSWKISGLFAMVLAGLYGFNYVLISLEDTALLVGSVSLFIVLAIVMYVSRKINWYNPSLTVAQQEAV